MRKWNLSSVTVLVTAVMCCSFAMPATGQWVNVTSNLPDFGRPYAIDAVDGQTAVLPAIIVTDTAATQLYLTTNGGASWRLIPGPKGGVGQVWDISMIDSSHIWMVDTRHIYATSDCGASWNIQIDSEGMHGMFNYIEMFNLEQGVAMADGESDGFPVIYNTTDGGGTWVSVCTQEIGGVSYDLHHPIDFVNAKVGFFSPYISENPQLYKTTDGGCTWTLLTMPGSAGMQKPGGVINPVQFYDEQIGMMMRGGPYRTTDGGVTWNSIEQESFWPYTVAFCPGNPAQVFAATFSDMFASADTGKTWVLEYSGASGEQFQDIVVTADGYGWAMTIYAIYRRGEIAASVYDGHNMPPDGFKLKQNYPNPFNPDTRISFRLGKREPVSLDVYNILGVHIVTLAEGMQEAGMHTVTWTAVDGNGNPLPSGVYLARLMCGERVEQKKMVLMR